MPRFGAEVKAAKSPLLLLLLLPQGNVLTQTLSQICEVASQERSKRDQGWKRKNGRRCNPAQGSGNEMVTCSGGRRVAVMPRWGDLRRKVAEYTAHRGRPLPATPSQLAMGWRGTSS